jgi:hypothetical protein
MTDEAFHAGKITERLSALSEKGKRQKSEKKPKE